MRFVRRKLYRAFPEFDEYSDDECERFLERMWEHGSNVVALIALVLTGVVYAILYFGLGIHALLMRFVDAIAPIPLYVADSVSPLRILIAVPVIAAPFFLGMWLAFLARDARLRVSVRKYLNRVLCPACKYSLLGQTATKDGHVRCPECSRTFTLAQLKLRSAEQLLPPNVHPRTSCIRCEYSLIGQSVDDAGRVRCPECGKTCALGELGLWNPRQLLPPGVNPRTPTT